MSELLREQRAQLGERSVRCLRGGEGRRLLLLLHTGIPGRSAFAGSADLFADLAARLDLDGFRVLAPDLPGAGGTDLRGLEDLTPDGIVAFLHELLREEDDFDSIDVLAHGESSLAALKLTREGFRETPVRSCFLLAPNAAAPVGDSLQNLALLVPPLPRWSRRSQRWAVERLAYFPDRVPAELVDRFVANAEGEPHGNAAELLRDQANGATLLSSNIQAQDELFAYCRDVSYQVPVTIFWGAEDPTASVPRGIVLASVLAGGPAPLDFQLLNRCSHFAQFDRAPEVGRMLRAALLRAG